MSERLFPRYYFYNQRYHPGLRELMERVLVV